MSVKSKKEILGISTINHKYQATIPKEVKESQKWKEGDKILFVKENDRIYLTISTDL